MIMIEDLAHHNCCLSEIQYKELPMKIQRKSVGLLLFVAVILILSFVLLLALVTWLVASGKIRFSGYPGEVTRYYGYSLLEDEVAIVESYNIKPGGRLIYIKKIDGLWNPVQTIENLEDILGDYKLFKVAHNKDWLCISTYRAISERKEKKQRLFLFKQSDGLWQYVNFIEGGVGSISDIELLSDNRLLYSQYTEEMGVCCYDLNVSPPKLTQIVKREHRDGRQSVFATEFHVTGDTLYVFDFAGYVSPEEEKRYKLTDDDYGVFSTINGKHYQVYTCASVLAYRDSGTKWEFECEFYPLLPHPLNGALRMKEKFRSSSTKNFYYPRVQFRERKPRATSQKAYLTVDELFYVFEKNSEGEWRYSHNFSPPNFYVMPLPSAKRIIRSQCDPVQIDEKYSIAVRDDATFAVYKTEDLEKWQALWDKFIVSEKHSKIATKYRNDSYSNGDVRGNTVLVCYNSTEPDSQSSSWKTLRGRIIIYEIDDETGPREVFRLDATDNDGLKPAL